jgi:hypothetical protein
VYCLYVNVYWTTATRITGHFSTTLTEGFPCFSSVVRQMLWYNSQRRDTAGTSQFFSLFLLLCMFRFTYSVYCLCANVYCTAVLFVCKCVLYCCTVVCKCVLYCCTVCVKICTVLLYCLCANVYCTAVLFVCKCVMYCCTLCV